MEEAWEFAALVMTSNDEIDVSLGPEGGSVKLKGELAKNTSRNIGDLFKPLVQFIGEKGDAVEHQRIIRKQIRVFNEQALQIALEKAQENAKQSGINLEPVPIKFLAQWAEGVSLEDSHGDDNLISLWANLLVTASSGESRNLNLFSDILKKLDPTHAKFLSFIVENGEFRLWMDCPGQWSQHRILVHIEEYSREKRSELTFDELTESEIVEMFKEMLTPIDDCPGVLITLAMCSFYDCPIRHRPPTGGTWDINFSYDHNLFPENVIYPLISLNILENISIDDIAPLSPKCGLVLNCVRLTDFGVGFLEACIVQHKNKAVKELP